MNSSPQSNTSSRSDKKRQTIIKRWDESANLAYFYQQETNSNEARVDGAEGSASPQLFALPPLATSDVMDCFRLYFGSNVTIYPFYAARLGAVGIIFIIFGAIGLNLMTQSALHRARFNMAVLELRKRREQQCAELTEASSFPVSKVVGDPSPCSETPTLAGGPHFPPLAADASSDTLTTPTTTASTTSAVASPLSPLSGAIPSTASTTPTTRGPLVVVSTSAEAALVRLATPAKRTSHMANMANDVSHLPRTDTGPKMQSRRSVDVLEDSVNANQHNNLVPYGLHEIGSLVKLSHQLWPDHWLKSGITYCTVVAQFFGTCGFVLMLANNVAPVVGITDAAAVNVCAVAMGLLSMDTSLTTKTILAYCNNLFILGGAFLLLVATAQHEATDEEKGMALQMLPKSIADFAMYAPSVVAYVAPQLVTIDAETVLSERIYRLHFANLWANRKNRATHHNTGGASSHAVVITDGGEEMAGKEEPGREGQIDVNSNHQSILQDLTDSLGQFVALQRCFRRALYLGAGCSALVLLFVAEFIMLCFKDNTNAIIALSLPTSTLRTLILLSLCVGLYACGVLNIGPICDVLDVIASQLKRFASRAPSDDEVSMFTVSFANPLLQRLIARMALFGLVVVFLYLVPFFDLVAALSGAVCTPTYVFFVPVVCELQSEVLKAAEAQKSANDASSDDANEGHEHETHLSLGDGWRGMPLASKALAVVSLVLGSTILVFSTFTVITETLRRRSQ